MLHMSQYLSWRDLCENLAWSDHYFTSNSNTDIYKIWIMSTLILCQSGPLFHFVRDVGI